MSTVLSCSDLGGAVFAPEETENESFHSPRPFTPGPGILESSGSVGAQSSGSPPDGGWRPGFSPSDFIGSVNQPGLGEQGKVPHSGEVLIQTAKENFHSSSKY